MVDPQHFDTARIVNMPARTSVGRATTDEDQGTGERVGEAAQAPGTSPPARRRRLLRATALLTGAALLLGVLQTVGAGGALASAPETPAKAASGSRTASLSLDTLNPRIPAKGDTVTVTGTVTNNGKSTITGPARIAVHVGSGGPLPTRSALNSAAARIAYNSAQDGYEINGQTVNVPDLAAGRSRPFSIKIPISALGLGASGVYLLGISLDGQDAAEPWDHVLGITRTFLPWYADSGTAKATRINYLWPLTDRPHIAASGDSDSQQSPLFLDDDLAQELKPGGRLGQMVDLAKNLQVTWIVDPDLLATVEAMTKPYRVAGPGDDTTHTKPGTGTAVANAWLNSLKSAVAGDEVIALPFGDPDIASLAHNGNGVTSNLRLVSTGTVLGKTTVDNILGTHSTTDVAWPVDGAIDPSVVSVARSVGAHQIITRSDSLQESDSLDYTPNAARPIGGGMTAVVADAPLSTAFDGSMSTPQETNLAIQDFIAQTLMITMQAPDKQRTVVVAPQRTPTVAQAKAMADAITATDASQWSSTIDFSTAAKAQPDPRASRKVPPSSAYPKSLREQELSPKTFDQIHLDQINLNGFVIILTIKDRVTVPFRNAMLRAISTGQRGDPHGEALYRNAIGVYLQNLIGAVRILDKHQLTLSGRSGTIPITVKNDLNQPITGLVLRLTSGIKIRLKIHNPDQPIAIGAGHTRTLKFQTTASANGPAQISAGLYTRNGALYGSNNGAISFKVQISNVTDLVMLIIAAGLLLLVLAGVRIYRQRKRQAAADHGSDGGTGGNGSGGDGIDPGQPGDPAADISQESPEPSPAGEKVDG
jgi:hypothetical protein